jgi:hypothetical protein
VTPNLRLLTMMVACLISATMAQAAGVRMSGSAPRQDVTVTINDATVDIVLDQLRKRYSFEVSGLENAAQGEAISTTMSGSLYSVIERLLRNWNHMIVRSPDNKSGIAQLVILNSSYGAPQRATIGGRTDPNSPPNANDDADVQAFVGGRLN